MWQSGGASIYRYIEADTTSMVSKNVDSYLKQFLSTNKHMENFKS